MVDKSVVITIVSNLVDNIHNMSVAICFIVSTAVYCTINIQYNNYYNQRVVSNNVQYTYIQEHRNRYSVIIVICIQSSGHAYRLDPLGDRYCRRLLLFRAHMNNADTMTYTFYICIYMYARITPILLPPTRDCSMIKLITVGGALGPKRCLLDKTRRTTLPAGRNPIVLKSKHHTA